MTTKTCPICGKEFTIEKGNHKYCSDACRIEGSKRARKEWKDRTGFREKHREEMRKYRAQISAEKAQQKAEIEAERRRAMKEKCDKILAEKHKRDQELLDKGDPWTRMRHSAPGYLDYWIAFQEYELDCASRSGKPSTVTVNGISVYTDRFPEEALKSIKDQKIIIIWR